MSTTILVFLAIQGVTPPPTAAANSAVVRYRFELEYVSDLDRRAVGGQYLHGVTKLSAALSFTARDSANGTLVHFVIDSMRADPQGEALNVMDPSAATWARGAAIDAFVVAGKIRGTPRESMNSVAVHLLVPAVELLFTSEWRKAVSQNSWQDTTSMEFHGPGGNSRVGSTIGKWTVVERRPETLLLDQSTVTSWVTEGHTGPDGTPMESRLRIDGTGSAHAVLDGHGELLAATSRTTRTGTVAGVEPSTKVPLKNSITISVRRAEWRGSILPIPSF